MLAKLESQGTSIASQRGADECNDDRPTSAKRPRKLLDYFKPRAAKTRGSLEPETTAHLDKTVDVHPCANIAQEQSLTGSKIDSGPLEEAPTVLAVPAEARSLGRKLPGSFAKGSFGSAHTKEQGQSTPQQLPTIDFRNFGRIIYACTPGEVEEVCSSCLQRGITATGWDLEWRTTFRPGEPPRKTALMQICYQTKSGGFECLLLHIFYSGLTPSVAAYLKDPAVAKAGVNAGGDAHKIFRDYGLQVEGVTDLTSHPVVQAEPQLRSRSLASLTERYMGRKLLKDSNQLSNWEMRPLRLEQQLYAATDAFVSLRLFQILQSKPQPEPPQALPEIPPAAFMDGEDQPAAVWIPPLPDAERLQPAKAAVHRMITEQGFSIAQVALLRRIQEVTVAAYLAEAVIFGHGYNWPQPTAPASAISPVMALAKQMLLDAGRDLASRDVALQLQEAGIGLREFQSKLSVSLDFGQIRILLAHIGRQQLLLC